MALEHKSWKGTTGGTPWMQRFLISYLRHFSLRSLYFIMAFVAPFYMLFNHRGYLAIYHYFHDRMGLNPFLSFCWTWKNHYRFGQIILDRFAMYAGKKFEFEKVGSEEFERLCFGDTAEAGNSAEAEDSAGDLTGNGSEGIQVNCDAGDYDKEKSNISDVETVKEENGGMVMLGAHIGNYELSGYSLNPGNKKIYTLVFGGETDTVMDNRTKAFSKNGISMINVADDMSHIFRLNDALVHGDIVSMPGDRMFGSCKYLTGRLLWADAKFPAGPFTVAAQRNLPTFAVFSMKESTKKYKLYVFRLDDEESRAANRNERAALLLKHYTRHLERILLKYPAQWFNYYEFWEQ